MNRTDTIRPWRRSGIGDGPESLLHKVYVELCWQASQDEDYLHARRRAGASWAAYDQAPTDKRKAEAKRVSATAKRIFEEALMALIADDPRRTEFGKFAVGFFRGYAAQLVYDFEFRRVKFVSDGAADQVPVTAN